MRQFTVIDADQRSEAWIAARLGRLTSSTAAEMLAVTQKGSEASGRRNLRMRLVLERITNRSQERGFLSPAMQHGIDTEAEAFAYYEAFTGQLLQRSGFLQHTDLMAGASLDGHLGDFEWLAEIKCPLPATHWDYLKTGKVPGDYAKQILHQLWISGARGCDWMSYCAEFPDTLRAKIVRVERHEPAILDYEQQARTFLAEVETEVRAVHTMANLLGTLQAVVG